MLPLYASAHVHANNFVYRDLQPANVLICMKKPRKLKLVDFGRAIHVKPGSMLEPGLAPLGTTIFQAPEVKRCRLSVFV